MKTTALNLLVSDKPDEERDSVAESFAKCGGTVHRIGRFWDPPPFEPSSVRVCGADSFCLVLQQKLGLTLCSPDDELLLRVPSDLLGRQITRSTLVRSLDDRFSFVHQASSSEAVSRRRLPIVLTCTGCWALKAWRFAYKSSYSKSANSTRCRMGSMRSARTLTRSPRPHIRCLGFAAPRPLRERSEPPTATIA